MANILVISGHPNLEHSFTNVLILQELEQRVNNLSVRRLDKLYPQFQIDVAAEQQALLAADIIVLQFPFYWYSVPALLKKWIDDVLTFNFAYGAEGTKLKGKDLVLSFTVGGPEASYSPLGYNHFSVEQCLRPLEQLTYLTGMNFIKPVYTNGMIYIPNIYNTLEGVQEKARNHAKRLIDCLDKLANLPEKKVAAFIKNWFSQFDLLPEQPDFFIQHITADTKFSTPEATFVGNAGFINWYKTLQKTFKPNCQHLIEKIEITPDGHQFKANLKIRLIADTYPDSAFQGKAIDLLVNETWSVELDAKDHINIHFYLVEPQVN